MDHPTHCYNCGGSTFHKTMHKTYIRFTCVRRNCGKGQSFRIKSIDRQRELAIDEFYRRQDEAMNPYASSNVGNWSK